MFITLYRFEFIHYFRSENICNCCLHSTWFPSQCTQYNSLVDYIWLNPINTEKGTQIGKWKNTKQTMKILQSTTISITQKEQYCSSSFLTTARTFTNKPTSTITIIPLTHRNREWENNKRIYNVQRTTLFWLIWFLLQWKIKDDDEEEEEKHLKQEECWKRYESPHRNKIQQNEKLKLTTIQKSLNI